MTVDKVYDSVKKRLADESTASSSGGLHWSLLPHLVQMTRGRLPSVEEKSGCVKRGLLTS
jgi:hypothetical protein